MAHRIYNACPTSLPCPPVSSSNYILWDARRSASVVADAVSPRCCAVRLDCLLILSRLFHAEVGGSNCLSNQLAGAVTPGSTWPGTLLVKLPSVSPWPHLPATYRYFCSRSCTPLLIHCGWQNLKNLLCSSSKSAMVTPNLCLRLLP